MPCYAIATLGCKVNSYESQSYREALHNAHFSEVEFKSKADIYIINTCAVTNTAASKSRQKIHAAKKMNPNAIIVVIGCYVQIEHDELLRNEKIDILIGSDQKNTLVARIQKTLAGISTHTTFQESRQISVFESLSASIFKNKTRAFLKIQDGCNQFCSYCIIPYARGKERSLQPSEVIMRAQEFVKNNHQEIVLTGIHTGRYGSEYQTNLVALLKRLCKEVPNLKRIRISSIEINEVSDELLAFMKNEKKIARHLHIPLQSANNKILKAMNRPYDVAYYKNRLAIIRKELSDKISISSDIIVGFPNESDQDFEQSYQTIKEMQLSFLHIFPYSTRKGTVAEKLDHQVHGSIKKARCSKLAELSNALYTAYKEKLIDKVVKVLFEEELDGMMVGHSSEYILVSVPYQKEYLHKLCNVKIEKISQNGALGCLHEEVYA